MTIKNSSDTIRLLNLKLLVYLGISSALASCAHLKSKIETDFEITTDMKQPECGGTLVPFSTLNSQEVSDMAVNNKPNGVVLLIPGLNNSIEAMAPLAKAINAKRFHVEQLELPGQGTGVCRSQHIKELWRASIKDAMHTITQRHPATKVYMIGYSLGGSLVADYLINSSAGPQPKKAVLIAPAIKLTTKTSMARLVTWLRHFGLSLPSFAPKELQAHSSVPLNHYSATLELADTNGDHADAVLSKQTEVLVLISSTDTLVSSVETKLWIESLGVEHFKFHEVIGSNSCGHRDGHYLPFPRFVGEANFNDMTDEIIQFLEEGE